METRIKEIEPEVPIIVNKFKFTCDDADPTIPKPLPQMGGVCDDDSRQTTKRKD